MSIRVILLATFLWLNIYQSICAEPFLISDPQTDATKFRIRFSTDGTTWGAWSEGNPVNNAMRFDLGGITVGTYQGQAQAGASTSVTDPTSGVTTTVPLWSDSSPFVLRVPNKNKPSKIIISPN
jgi:hypothetical protein